jgi:hypothetical protein
MRACLACERAATGGVAWGGVVGFAMGAEWRPRWDTMLVAGVAGRGCCGLVRGVVGLGGDPRA